jgi:hypothetical protein
MIIPDIKRHEDGSATIIAELTKLEMQTLIEAGFIKILEDYTRGVDNVSESPASTGSE